MRVEGITLVEVHDENNRSTFEGLIEGNVLAIIIGKVVKSKVDVDCKMTIVDGKDSLHTEADAIDVNGYTAFDVVNCAIPDAKGVGKSAGADNGSLLDYDLH